MSAGSPKSIISYIVILLLVSLWIISCTSSYKPPAPISSINKQSSTNNNDPCSMPITMFPPKMKLATQLQTSISQSSRQPVQNHNNSIIFYQDRKYANILKGNYTGGNTYTVKRGDTLFYIAWITGNDVRNLAQWNNVKAPYNLEIGQKLLIGNVANKPLLFRSSDATLAADISSQNNHLIHKRKSTKVIASRTAITYPKKMDVHSKNKMLLKTKNVAAQAAATTISSAKSTAANTLNRFLVPIWHWPTSGKVIEGSSKRGDKGINILGCKGQNISAAADGYVVYVGNALRGYGNLIIIKHNNNYLSAYAHNDTILVKEQQKVKAGQKIATMGSTGTSFTCLHFEIRYKGKSVNPLYYLPQQ